MKDKAHKHLMEYGNPGRMEAFTVPDIEYILESFGRKIETEVNLKHIFANEVKENRISQENEMLQKELDKIPFPENEYIVEGFFPPRPKFLGRRLKEGGGTLCPNCHSTASKDGWLGLFGNRLCDNNDCPNSIYEKAYGKLGCVIKWYKR